MIDLPTFRIGNLEMNLIQGGMGIGISGPNLTSAVANQGGAGTIASVGLGFLEGPSKDYAKANCDALRKAIRDARKKSNGVIGVNIMYALEDYEDLVRVAVDEKVDYISSGAGLAKNLPGLIGVAPICAIPIVRDKRTAAFMAKAWWRNHKKIPDAFIVEGPPAGGHVAFEYEDLVNNTTPSLESLIKEVVEFTNNPHHFDNPIPVIGAGGIYTGEDIKIAQSWGCAGVQMSTRFVTTRECDAHDNFKLVYLGANKEDMIIIKSPLGMPGRAIRNKFLDRIRRGEQIEFKCEYKCLKNCKQQQAHYCISQVLVNAQQGNVDEGLIFGGANAYRATPETCLDPDGKFIPVGTLMPRISDEYQAAA